MYPTSFSLGKSAPAGSSTSRNRQSGRHPSFTSKYSNFSFSTTVLVESICLPTSSAYLSSGFQIVVQLGTPPEIEAVNIRNDVPIVGTGASKYRRKCVSTFSVGASKLIHPRYLASGYTFISSSTSIWPGVPVVAISRWTAPSSSAAGTLCPPRSWPVRGRELGSAL
jgi:hypothetical protein